MKISIMTNEIIVRNFLKAILDIIAENTSFNYSRIAINGIKNQLSKEFKFLKNINIKGKSIRVNTNINSIDKSELRKFFIIIIDMIGPNYLKVLLSRKLNQKDIMYLEGIGIRFG